MKTIKNNMHVWDCMGQSCVAGPQPSSAGYPPKKKKKHQVFLFHLISSSSLHSLECEEFSCTQHIPAGVGVCPGRFSVTARSVLAFEGLTPSWHSWWRARGSGLNTHSGGNKAQSHSLRRWLHITVLVVQSLCEKQFARVCVCVLSAPGHFLALV